MNRINICIEKTIEGISNLPTLPAIVSKTRAIIGNSESTARDLARVIEQDISLSAKLLRLVNSAYYGMPRSITSIHAAVVILGFKAISTLVLSCSVFDLFPRDIKKEPFNRTAFWRHCTSCAFLSRFLAEQLRTSRPFDPEETFCAGLLHDIGHIVMEQYFHDDFHRALSLARHGTMPLYEAEIKTLGYSHADVGGWLTKRWSLPDPIRNAIVFHHRPDHAPLPHETVTLCHFADYLCHELKLSIDEAVVAPPFDESVLIEFDICGEIIDHATKRLLDELDNVNLFCEIAGERN
jgi:putative nucleotidyltransferase with HDIG domain